MAFDRAEPVTIGGAIQLSLLSRLFGRNPATNSVHARESMLSSVEALTGEVRRDATGWPFAWFRGEPDSSETALLPKLYRAKPNGSKHQENPLLQHFRMRAPTFASGHIPPDRNATDQWLFLAQHFGLATRLLDWTESVLVALHFALETPQPVVWMLQPMALNRLSAPQQSERSEFHLTWVPGIGSANIKGAWEDDGPGVELPVAVLPTNIHPRMSVQRSCFTVHGKNQASLAKLVGGNLLRRYAIDPEARNQMRSDLRFLGVDHSTVFPDLKGLADELNERF